MIAFKGNHIWSAGRIFMTYRIYLLITSSPRHRVYHRGDRVRTLVGGFSLLLDVEVRDEGEVNEAIATGADVIMLDSIEGSKLASVPWLERERWAR